MKNTPPKFAGGGHSVRQAGQSRVKATPNTKWMVTKKTVDPAKKGVGKKKIWSPLYQGGSTFYTFQNAPETRPLDQ